MDGRFFQQRFAFQCGSACLSTGSCACSWINTCPGRRLLLVIMTHYYSELPEPSHGWCSNTITSSKSSCNWMQSCSSGGMCYMQHLLVLEDQIGGEGGGGGQGPYWVELAINDWGVQLFSASNRGLSRAGQGMNVCFTVTSKGFMLWPPRLGGGWCRSVS
jgi:hypothetical protein